MKRKKHISKDDLIVELNYLYKKLNRLPLKKDILNCKEYKDYYVIYPLSNSINKKKINKLSNTYNSFSNKTSPSR